MHSTLQSELHSSYWPLQAAKTSQVDSILHASRRREYLQSRGTTAPAPASSSMMWASESMKDNQNRRGRLHTSSSSYMSSRNGKRSHGRGNHETAPTMNISGFFSGHLNDGGMDSQRSSTPFICRGWHGYQRRNLDTRQGGFGRRSRTSSKKKRNGNNEEDSLQSEEFPKSRGGLRSRSSGRLVDDTTVPFLHEFEIPTEFGKDIDRFGIMGQSAKLTNRSISRMEP